MPRVLLALFASAWLVPLALAQSLKPLNLDKVNTAQDEDDPFLSADRLRLYYASNAGGPFQIYFAERKTTNQLWPAGKLLDGPGNNSRAPFLSADDHDLYYATRFAVEAEDAAAKKVPDNFDLVHSINLSKGRQFTAPVPVQAACTPADELFPWLTADGRELFFSRKLSDGWRLFVAARAGKTGAFGEPKLVQELPAGFHHASLSRDGLTMYLQGPLEKGRWGLYRTARIAGAKWNQPQPIEGLNHPDAPTGDQSPCLSNDGSKLFFASDRPGGKGGRDLWIIDTSLLTGASGRR